MTGVTVRVADDYDALSRLGGDVVARFVQQAPGARVLVATGQTPMGVYLDLADRSRSGRLDASRLTVFQLDEYLGLAPGDPRSLGRWAVQSFVEPLGIPADRFVRLPLDGRSALEDYDRRVGAEGGYDLAILGIGENGHLAFNEPPCDASAPSREVALTPASVASNARYWGEAASVPRRAVTVGMAPLLAARTIVLLASGERKRAILRRALLGPVGPDVPASYLQRAGNVVVLVDRGAWPEGSDADGGTA